MRSSGALDALVALSCAVCCSHVVGFVVISRSTRSYAAEELFGNTRSARHTVLPAWRPLLVGCCQVLALVAGVEVALLASASAGGASGLRTYRGAWAWLDASLLGALALDGLVPSIVAQHAVSVAAFRRGAAFAAASLAVNGGLWAARVSLASGRARVVAGALTLRVRPASLSNGLLLYFPRVVRVPIVGSWRGSCQRWRTLAS